MPSVSVTATIAAPLAVSITVTVTPGAAMPVRSRTTPVIELSGACVRTTARTIGNRWPICLFSLHDTRSGRRWPDGGGRRKRDESVGALLYLPAAGVLHTWPQQATARGRQQVKRGMRLPKDNTSTGDRHGPGEVWRALHDSNVRPPGS